MKSKTKKTLTLPKVSFVICTLNCKEDLERCLKSIKEQDYPKDKVEIVIVDSYSTDGTIQVAKSYKAKLILTKVRGYMEGKGMPKSMGCEKASGEIIITLDSDNALVEKDWIRKTVYPLIVDKNVAYSISRMSVVHSDPLVNQYLSLVGTDPFAIYASLDPQISMGKVKLKDKGEYYTHNVTLKNFLITGGYYRAIRKKTLNKLGGYSRDVDITYLVAKNNLGEVAIPKNAHLHHLIATSAKQLFKQKLKWGKYYFDNPQLEREFEWSKGLFGKFGKIRFVYEVLISLLFLPDFFLSIKLAWNSREKSWLLHAPLKFLTTFAYLLAYFKSKTSNPK